nr:lysophospholipid acyltransferase family protein [uncultured Desulfuromonas sp.]
MNAFHLLHVIAMNVWVYSLLVVWTLVGVCLSPLQTCYLLWRHQWPLDRAVRHLIWLYGRGWLVLISPFVSFSRDGLTAQQLPERCVFVINHLSFFDTYFMAALPHSDVTFAVRSWPFKMFWYRVFMRLANYLEVEDLSWEETTARGTDVLQQGGSVLFFPEGHRSRDGKIQRFYSGAFQLAVAAQCPVVPLCITGTDELLPPGRKSLHPCRVQLRILPPVSVDEYQYDGGHLALKKQVKAAMVEALDEMTESRVAAAEVVSC